MHVLMKANDCSNQVLAQYHNKEIKMDNLATIGLIVIAVLAVLGLGIKVAINYKSGNRNKLKDVHIGGDFTGGDKK